MDKLALRDRLALERTRLANERTFLAYFRTALSLIAGGVILFEFFVDRPTYMVIAWILIVVAAVVLLLGVYRYQLAKRAFETEIE